MENIQIYKDLYEERAAIMQYDGGLTKERAEREAQKEVVDAYMEKHDLTFNSPRIFNFIRLLKRDEKTEL
jgi:hypothetical protein